MKYTISRIVYPEGNFQEISHHLKIRQVVDINGNPLPLPLSSSQIIAYEVVAIRTKSTRNENITEYQLELLSRQELDEFVRNRKPLYGL